MDIIGPIVFGVLLALAITTPAWLALALLLIVLRKGPKESH